MQRKSLPRSGNGSRPPRLARLLLRLFSPREERDGLLGDLAEEYRRHRAPLGHAAARRWYWGQVLRSLAPGLQRPPVPVPPTPKGDSIVATFFQDIRYGVRSLGQAPGFTFLTILTLTLAIGVNSAIFSMVSVIFFSDLPIQDTDNMVFVRMQNPERGILRGDASLPDFIDYRAEIESLPVMGGVETRAGVLSGIEEPARVVVAASTANLFRMWGTPMALGRDFVDGEDAPGAERVAILSHGLWERRFAADEGVVGRLVKVDGYPTTIVGVGSPTLEFGDLAQVDLWVPIDLSAERPRDQRSFFVGARLKPGATMAQAQAEATAVAEQLAATYPETNKGWAVEVQSFNDGLADDGFWTVLLLLTITVALVMMLACSNVATMTLARATGRQQELAVRAALGAGRGRILRQLLTESLVLSLASGLLGLLVARASLFGLTWITGPGSDISTFFVMLEIDRYVMGFTLLVALLAPILFGLIPALRSSRSDLAATLKEGGRTAGNLSALRGRRLLVATQVSLAIMLMVVAGLVIRSLVQVRAMDYAHEPDSILTMRVDLPEAGYPDGERLRLFREELQRRTESMAGVARVTWVSHRVLADRVGTVSFEIEQGEARTEEQTPWAFSMSVGPAYFDMMRLRPLLGRLLRVDDREDSAPVALVNAAAVERFWPPGADPVGTRIRTGGGDWLEIVGVVSDEVYPDPANPIVPLIYTAHRQQGTHTAALMVEAVGDPLALTAPIRRAVLDIDPDQPIADVRTQARIFADDLASMDAVASMFGGFAFFALVMAAAGIYGVLSFVVAQRTREIGVRMALGARVTDVRGLVMRNSGALIVGGLVVGVLGAIALGALLASGVPEIDAADPLVYGAVAVVLMLVAAAAAWVPARRATRVEPVIALRSE